MILQKPRHITKEQAKIAEQKALHSINMLFALVEIMDYYHTDLQENLAKIHANKFYFKKQATAIKKNIQWFREFAISSFGSEEKAEGFFDLTDQIYEAIQKEINKPENK